MSMNELEFSMNGFYTAVKRIEDIVIALVALAMLSPVFIVVPILIKLEDGGPVFFRQPRFGHRNRLFDCLKFRSMSVHQSEHGKVLLTERNDPRVTKVGRIIRKLSLDEIPQFINVLKGDMSVVGPRPHPPGVKAGDKTYEEAVERFEVRYCVKPGITGWAQVNGLRGNTFTVDDIRNRFEYDMYYIRHWSLWLDIVIIVRTALLGFTGKNAF